MVINILNTEMLSKMNVNEIFTTFKIQNMIDEHQENKKPIS